MITGLAAMVADLADCLYEDDYTPILCGHRWIAQSRNGRRDVLSAGSCLVGGRPTVEFETANRKRPVVLVEGFTRDVTIVAAAGFGVSGVEIEAKWELLKVRKLGRSPSFKSVDSEELAELEAYAAITPAAARAAQASPG